MTQPSDNKNAFTHTDLSSLKAPLLSVRNLEIRFSDRTGDAPAVHKLSYQLGHGRTLGVVGESGCGKTITALAILDLLDPPGKITEGEIKLEGKDLRLLSSDTRAKIRGSKMGMVFQEPLTALNPVFTIGEQIAEVVVQHLHFSKKDASSRAIELLDLVRVPSPDKRIRDYPHQLSGGLRQRAMIAMAIAGEPILLIADEPTTALDVTVQSQILDLFLDLQQQTNMTIQFISHDLAVVSEIADEVLVLYAGRVVERASAQALFSNPLHPYSRGLLETMPRLDTTLKRLPAIPGQIPVISNLPTGCPFRDRCPIAAPECSIQEPKVTEVGHDHWVACLKVDPP